MCLRFKGICKLLYTVVYLIFLDMSLKTPIYLGVVHHPAIGIRIPHVFLPGILRAFKLRRTVGTLMLSYGRETAPEYVINAPPGKYEITRGHTGTSIKEYLSLAANYAFTEGVVVELEADHVSVSVSSIAAVKRISGVKSEYEISDEDIDKALKYIEDEVEEAVSTGVIRFYTLDTCELIRYEADKMDKKDLDAAFEGIDGWKRILERYLDKRFTVIGESGKSYNFRFREEEIKRIAVKYWRSIEVAERVYKIFQEKTPWEFGIEIAFDETPHVTEPKEMLFYLNELWERGIPVDYIAPNVGFEKKKDYSGSLEELYRRVEIMSAIARRYGALLSFHSGSGSTPWTGKGPGVYETLLEATGYKLKYKVSGVYFELLMEIFARQPKGSKARKLFEDIYDSVIEYVRKEIEKKGPLYSKVMEEQLREYENLVERTKDPYLPWADIFRYYSFLALNLRDEGGERPFRRRIIELYEEDEALRNVIDREVAELTLRLIDGLDFKDNIDLL